MAASGERRRSRTRKRGPRAGTRTEDPTGPSTSGPLGNPKLTFDQFVIGDSNRLAHAAALTVAEMPAQAYNPLFICGPPGVGKTHLLSSIAGLLLAHNPGLAVRCTTGEAFTNEFLVALSDGRTDGFKTGFRQVDVLLVDDVQFLERKAKTEEEFFHTFNALYDAGRQIVLSSDRPPHNLQALEDRLRERFEAGLVADIKPPELATRLAILRKRAHHDRIELADPRVLEAIAERVTLNVRALEGALIRVVAFSSLTGRPLTIELAREVLDGLYPAPDAAPRSAHLGRRDPGSRMRALRALHRGAALPARTARVAWPRQVAMYLSRELTEESLPSIGRISADAITPRFSTPGGARPHVSPRMRPHVRLWRSCATSSAQPRSTTINTSTAPPERLLDRLPQLNPQPISAILRSVKPIHNSQPLLLRSCLT